IWVYVVLHELLRSFDPEVPFVGIVGNVHFLATQQFEVEAVLLTGEHLQFVEQGYASLACNWRVIGELRSQLDAPLAGRVAPGAARLLGRIEVVGNTAHLTRTARRFGFDSPDSAI